MENEKSKDWRVRAPMVTSKGLSESEDGCGSGPSGKGWQRPRTGEKGWFPGREGRHPLNAHFLHSSSEKGVFWERGLSETSKRHLKRQQPWSDAESHAPSAPIVEFLTCHFKAVGFGIVVVWRLLWVPLVYAWNRYNAANWRSHRECVHFFGPKWVIFGVLALQTKERLSRGLDVKWHIPSTSLDASRKWFSTGIYSINRAFKWLWLEAQGTPSNGQNVHGFQIITPICHIVPVSRAYGHCCLSMMARWRSRHFTAVTALLPQEAELEHSRVVVLWLL